MKVFNVVENDLDFATSIDLDSVAAIDGLRVYL